MPYSSLLKIAAIFSAVVISACNNTEPPTKTNVDNPDVTIVKSATIYTSDEQRPQIDGFAYQNGKIIALGSPGQLEQAYAGAKILDLKGTTVVPGLIDAHVHLMSLGFALSRVDLVASTDKDDILQRLQTFAAELPEGEWLLGRGWDQNDWPVKQLPTAADLDQAFPDRPVWLTRIDGHAAWANTAAMKYAKQDLDGDWQPDGGEIVRDVLGKPSGVFIDNAEAIIASQVPAPSEQQIRNALKRAMAKTASVGLTSVHNAGTSKQVWDVLQTMNSNGEMKLRFYAMADGNQAMLDYLCQQGPIIDPEAMLTARAVKLYSDGALGSRGAALLEPYSDDPDNSGLLIVKPETLSQYAKKAADCGLQVNIHAIGDRGNRVTLDAFEAAQNDSNPGRHRNEHAQVIAVEDFSRFKQMDIIASVQPTHATSDMYWAEERVGAERIKGAYAWQTFNKLGVRLALGSDFPVERPDVLPGFYAAVSRQDAKAWPADGWYPEQTLTRQQALHGFTLGAAYAAFQEDQIGSLEVGKRADFTVLSKDIMTIPAIEILSTKIEATYLNGTPVFQSE